MARTIRGPTSDATASGRRFHSSIARWNFGFFGLVSGIATGIPSLDPTRVQAGEVNGYIYANDAKTILAVLRGSEARVLVDWAEIGPWMKHAIVDVEDKRFYEHRGVDIRGIGRALWADVSQKGVVQGGSTITQQFVKNSLSHDQRTIARKLKEAALAWQLESGPHRWSKQRILTAYLNTIYFGHGAYGIEAASKYFFSTTAKNLSNAVMCTSLTVARNAPKRTTPAVATAHCCFL
jgi:penicillin-binding protein 1A